MTDERIESPEKIVAWWSEVIQNPGNYIEQLGEKKILYAAGGNLPQVFGKENKIWKALEAKATNDTITIAGVEFSLQELSQMGDFYRWAHTKEYYFHCIDERLILNETYKDAATHDHCGACAAVRAAAELPDDVEVILHDILGRESFGGNQKIDSEMVKAHRSLAVLVDLHGAGDTLNEEWRKKKKMSGALPFNVSIPLNLIEAWAEETGGNAEQLISTMVRWNVQIARNIIGGHHNDLHDQADKTVIITDQREVDQADLLQAVQSGLLSVQAQTRLAIVDS